MNLHDRELENGGETKKLLQETKKTYARGYMASGAKKSGEKMEKNVKFLIGTLA